VYIIGKLKYVVFLLPLSLTGCLGGGGGIGNFDFVGMIQHNIFVQIIIGIAVLWLVFRGAGNKH